MACESTIADAGSQRDVRSLLLQLIPFLLESLSILHGLPPHCAAFAGILVLSSVAAFIWLGSEYDVRVQRKSSRCLGQCPKPERSPQAFLL